MDIMEKYKGKILKSSSASVAEPVFSISDWQKLHGSNIRTSMMKTASALPNEKSYLLSHATIMSSVMVEPEPYDWYIKPECSHLVNNNDDAWENDVLKLSYRSFVGSYNFVEHYQNSEHSKGTIVDTILRKIVVAPDIWVYFCDLLVATALEHEDLVEQIKKGDIKYMSMGCVTDLVICSYCGHKVGEGDRNCYHLSQHKGSFLPDDDGIPRRVAELCGHKSLPNGGVTFVEASWVETPAFPGAVNRGIIANTWDGPGDNKKAASANSGLQKVANSATNIDSGLPNNNMVDNATRVAVRKILSR